ncbi:MAG: hypothetical protein EAZ24_03040 [Burkholderiales bacterium]|nr:MAG: hypothetical protein EAZ21_08320 [Betaproteobacteria bacterium]TAG83390.1 MAG: hypothetical protein EAZ24_03040 [Burkholderiales bacterium]
MTSVFGGEATGGDVAERAHGWRAGLGVAARLCLTGFRRDSAFGAIRAPPSLPFATFRSRLQPDSRLLRYVERSKASERIAVGLADPTNLAVNVLLLRGERLFLT